MTDNGDIAMVVTSVDVDTGIPTTKCYVNGVLYTGGYTVTQTEDFEIRETMLCRTADKVSISLLRMFAKNTSGVLPIGELWMETISGVPIAPLADGDYSMGACQVVIDPYVQGEKGILVAGTPITVTFASPVKVITFFGDFQVDVTFNTPVTGNSKFYVKGSFSTVQDTQLITEVVLTGEGEYIINAQN